ncbi:TonB-dependent outer membrane receptor, SusC/RagA subfamily, signature region [Chryseobacterium sp. RU37D]|uniref:TonB-dependent receptor plug domain-containing protein n=1 Tax=Chryseobacterium sp. RU37D TaxID=1907397 RepID=UPI00095632C9|nr:TonB-dependent receptor plug domain-containing protein [Chryseobacterium sp. RU37D]SIQ83881.1 TonB-dependent outer membrane receptor, SusC/RagA subfamily, signature region [Chryseobacterium sp. RU37D]
MENNHDIDKTFNEASKNLEEPATFPGFEKVWSSVEEKLDKKQDRKTLPIWLPYGIAASLLIISGIFYFNKNNKNIAKPIIVKNDIESQKNPAAISENIFKVDSTVKSNIQNQIAEPSAKIAYHESSKSYGIPRLPSYENRIQEPLHANAILAEQEKMDTVKLQNIEGVIAMGIPKEKASKVSSSQIIASSAMKKKNSGFNAVADTSEVIYPDDGFYLKEQSKESENLTLKNTAKKKSPIALNPVFGNKIGYTPDQNSVEGAAPEISINSISEKLASGKVETVIRGQSSKESNTSPIYFVDGKLMGSEEFKKLDVNKIVRMSVFKEAQATALFGSSASNGAIIVETKDISKQEKKKLEKLLQKELLKK